MNCLAAPRVIWSALFLFLAWSTAAQAAPAINNLSLRGLTAGQVVTLTIEGSDLPSDAQVLLPVPLAAQKVLPDAKPNRIAVELTVDSQAAPGIYLLRVASKSGISNPLAIAVDRLPQAAFGPTIESLPVALSGNLPGGQTLQTRFRGKKGDTVSLDLEAQRLGGATKPVVRLLDGRGTQLAYSPPLRTLGGDARLTATLPADGEYTIELHDLLYRGTLPNHFRLKVGPLQFADLALPLGVTRGSQATVSLPSSGIADAVAVDTASVVAPSTQVVPLPGSLKLVTGAAPRIIVSAHAEMTEPARQPPQLPALSAAPVAISGQLLQPGEEDRYELPVQPGQKLQVEVFAQRAGSPLDAVLNIYNATGGGLASSDDRAGTSDPLTEVTVPAGVTKLQLGIKDMQDRGGETFVYRLAVREAGAPDFSLSVTTDRLNIPAGGTQVLSVQATRRGYAGPIDLQLPGLPAGISVQGNKIAENSDIALVTLTAAPDTAGAHGLVQLVGTASALPQPVLRVALAPELPGTTYQPHLRQQLAIGVMTASPLNFAWTAEPNESLLLGDKLPARLSIGRQGMVAGNVRVRLLTTQPTPKKKIKENNQDKEVDDLEAALRLDTDVVVKPDQPEVVANILVPSELPQRPWDLVLIADLLAADGKTVTSSIATPVRTLTPRAPFQLALTGAGEAEGKAGAGDTGKLVGKVERVASFKQPVVVTLDGLPKGYTAPQVIVPADRSEFELPLVFPFGSKPRALKDVKLVALAAPVSVNSVRSNSVNVTVNVVPGEKPPAEKPLEVFEDDEKFVALLTEGGGRAVPENRDKYRGSVCLRVNGDQKFNPKLPMLGMNVRENPGPGEVRYIRFAWKKQGGNTICLQLNHDGQWGPGGSGREGAKFRYHAGPGGECYGGSLVIDEQLPAKFTVVTRDLFADFGEFTLSGMAFSAVDGQAALFDHIYLGRSLADFDLLQEMPAK
jgi:hypothetical protein